MRQKKREKMAKQSFSIIKKHFPIGESECPLEKSYCRVLFLTPFFRKQIRSAPKNTPNINTDTITIISLFLNILIMKICFKPNILIMGIYGFDMDSSYPKEAHI